MRGITQNDHLAVVPALGHAVIHQTPEPDFVDRFQPVLNRPAKPFERKAQHGRVVLMVPAIRGPDITLLNRHDIAATVLQGIAHQMATRPHEHVSNRIAIARNDGPPSDLTRKSNFTGCVEEPRHAAVHAIRADHDVRAGIPIPRGPQGNLDPGFARTLFKHINQRRPRHQQPMRLVQVHRNDRFAAWPVIQPCLGGPQTRSFCRVPKPERPQHSATIGRDLDPGPHFSQFRGCFLKANTCPPQRQCARNRQTSDTAADDTYGFSRKRHVIPSGGPKQP